MSFLKVALASHQSIPRRSMLILCPDDFEVAIFLRESRTRHSLLTRNKTFHDPGKSGKLQSGEAKLESEANDTTGPNEIMIESDSELDELHNIPESVEDDIPASGGSERKYQARASQAQPQDDPGGDEKKLQFSTHYESFNICGWVLCLLITRKGDKKKSSATTSETNPQPLMEEWISTQAQASFDD